MERYLYLFYGFGGEYVLHPIAQYMKDRGFEVLELDLMEQKTPGIILQSIKGRKIVFITSWHLCMDNNNFETFYKKTKVFSVLEAMNYLHPIKSVYYPHDLREFLHESELKWVDLFDLVLLPFKNWQYPSIINACGNVDCVGWIKKNKTLNIKQGPVSGPLNYLYFPSDISEFLIKFGLRKWIDNIKTYIPGNVKIKLPNWDFGVNLVEELTNNGYTVLDSKLTLFDIASESCVIMSHAACSIILEAGYSGLPTVSIVRPIKNNTNQNMGLENYDNIMNINIEDIRDFIKNTENNNVLIQNGTEELKEFDMARAVNAIVE